MWAILLILSAAAALSGCTSGSPAGQSAIAGSSDEIAARPQWRVGDRWDFRSWSGLTEGRYSIAVVEATEAGYTTRTGSERRYWTPDLELISVTKKGRVTDEFSPPNPVFKFPLRANMKWQQGGGLAQSGGT